MALTMPTAAKFKERFPMFEKLSKEHIDDVLLEAGGYVDETWIEGDQQSALLYMAAHLLLSSGALSAGVAGAVKTVTRGPVTSVRVGDVSTTYASGGSSSGGAAVGSNDWLMLTEFGKRFLRLRRRSFPAVYVI